MSESPSGWFQRDVKGKGEAFEQEARLAAAFTKIMYIEELQSDGEYKLALGSELIYKMNIASEIK